MREMLCGWLGILQTPEQLVNRTPLFVQWRYGTEGFIRPPKLGAHHPFPQLKPRQVYLVMAGPGLIKIQNRCQVPLPLPLLKEEVVFMKVFVTEAGPPNV